jgi:hypothetical protein
MSLQTWLNEFGTKTDLEKFIGLRKENIEKHGCFLNEDCDVEDSEGNVFMVNGESCQICDDYFNTEKSCGICPLGKIERGCYDDISPWRKWKACKDPEPMIEALTQILGDLPQRTEKVNEIIKRHYPRIG